MSGLAIFAVLFVVMTIGALFLGFAIFVKGGEFNKKYGNRLMQLRVFLQMGALLLIGIIFLLDGKG